MQQKIEKYGIGTFAGSVATVGLLLAAQSVFATPSDSMSADSSSLPLQALESLDQRASSNSTSNIDLTPTEELSSSDSQRLETERETDEESSDVFGHNQNSAYILQMVKPDYPSRALERGIEGYVILEFTVSKSGSVVDPVVVDSDPPGIFDRAALSTIPKLQYRPSIVDGAAVRTEGVRHRIDFEIEGRATRQTTASDSTNPDEYSPIFSVSATYPERALERGIEGHVVLEFIVDESGSVVDPAVVNSEPDGIFDRAALQAISKFKFKPRTVDGVTVRTEQVRQRLEFKLDEAAKSTQAISDATNPDDYTTIRNVSVSYPQRALQRGIEGYVILEYTVDETGSVIDPVVIESKPMGIFDRAAIEASSKFVYEPKVVDGEAVRTEGVKHRVEFELEDSNKKVL